MMDRVSAEPRRRVYSDLDGVGEMAHGIVTDAKNQGQSTIIVGGLIAQLLS